MYLECHARCIGLACTLPSHVDPHTLVPPLPPLPLSSLHPYTQPLKIGYLELRFCYCFLSFLYIGIGDIKKK